MTACALYALSLFAKATLLLLGSTALAFFLRRRSASVRHGLWSLAMIALLLLPALTLLLPVLPVEIAQLAPAASVQVTTPAAVSAPVTAISPRVETRGERARANARFWTPTTEPSAAPRPSFAQALLAIYLLVVIYLLGRLVLAHIAAGRLLRRATPVVDEQWVDRLARAAATLGVDRPVRLLRSDEVPVPFAVGLRHPAVVLPIAADSWSPARRAAVLSHELAHVQRRDCLTQALASLACAIYWPHPLAWWAASRLRLERELACDDRALGLGQAPADYAGHLLELARSFRPRPSLAPAAMGMAAPSQLEQRLRSVLDAARERAAPGRPLRIMATLAFVLVLLPLAAMRAVPPEDGGPAPAKAAPTHRAAAARPHSSVAAELKDIDPFDPTDLLDVVQADDLDDEEDEPQMDAADEQEPVIHEPVLEDAPETSPDPDADTPTTGEWTITDRRGDTATLELFWDDGTNWRRELKLEELDGDDDRNFRIDGEAGVFEFHGKLAKGRGSFEFVPDRGFPARLRAIGVRDADHASDHQLKNLAYGGASVEAVEEFRALGFSDLSLEDLTSLAVFNIRPEFVREMRAKGKSGTNTVAGITGLRIHE